MLNLLAKNILVFCLFIIIFIQTLTFVFCCNSSLLLLVLKFSTYTYARTVSSLSLNPWGWDQC